MTVLIEFSRPLIEGRLIQRMKRFLADVELHSGQVIRAHCPNTGSMKTCGSPGDTVLLSHDPNPNRKLEYTWELTQTKDGYVGVNTARPNQVTAKAVERGLIPELAGYDNLRKEVAYGTGSRIDLLLSGPGERLCYVEIKNTTLLVGDEVRFPDAVTSRGLKHLHELAMMVKAGHRAVMLFFVNRPEGKFFAPASDIDPQYGEALRSVAAAGVEILAYRAVHSPLGISLGSRVDVKLT
jgi:sugar fermentation stimulation protein A